MELLHKFLFPALVALLASGCAPGSLSFVKPVYKSSVLSFSEIKAGSIVYNELDSSMIQCAEMSGFEDHVSLWVADTCTERMAPGGITWHRQAVADVFGVTIDSLNEMLAAGFRKQLTEKYPHIEMVKIETLQTSARVPFELRVRKITIGQATDYISHSPVARVGLKVNIDLIDRRKHLTVLKLESRGDVVRNSDIKPWRRCVDLAIARFVDYLQSNGENNTRVEN
jgi:hypothetical protein